MAVNLDIFLFYLVAHVIIGVIVLSPALWVAGRLLAGRERAKFTDAVWISVLGIVIADVLGVFIYGLIAGLIVLFIWVALIKYFFDCGWLKAVAIGIIALVILFVIALIVGIILGIAILTFI
jgi:hypothetical protein